jgi:uncharacterized protein (UPF0333 family)
LKMAMERQGQLKNKWKRGQVMVEYLIVLLSVVLMYFLLNVLLGSFMSYGSRALDFITWKYP